MKLKLTAEELKELTIITEPFRKWLDSNPALWKKKQVKRNPLIYLRNLISNKGIKNNILKVKPKKWWHWITRFRQIKTMEKIVNYWWREDGEKKLKKAFWFKILRKFKNENT